MIRYFLIALSVFSLFMLPWQVTLVLGLLASLFFPIFALLLGAAAQMLYSSGGIPYALILGIVGCILAFVVRRFMKARIMGL